MTHDYETFATAAKRRLGNEIYTNASSLVVELYQQADHHSDYSEEIYSTMSVKAVAEGQYRIVAGDEGTYVRVVEVTEVDQDDDEVSEYTEVYHSAFAQWLWDRMTPSAQGDWCDRARVESFYNGIEEHRDLLFADQDAHPDTASGLLPYLKEQESWSQYATLLDKGDDPEMVDQDVYEHWIISNDAKRHLESVGEQVVEIMGLNIWCRTCTGQSFWYDSSMQQLGQRYLNK